jgi:outer membrane receptor for Fe3+-dicitrate
VGYYGYFNHRESEGFRQANSDYSLNGGHIKFAYEVDPDTRWILALDGYEEQHGEPGGLTAQDFARNPDKTTRFNDEFRLRRYAASLELQHSLSAATELSIKAWGGYYQRWSKRQRGGGFGSLPTGVAASTNNIENQEFYTFGIEPRIRLDWQAWGGEHSLAAGMQFYYNHSPREDQRGSSPDAEQGVTYLTSERNLTYGSLFVENKFTFGRLSITPGFRMELINQDVTTQNFDPISGDPTTGRGKSKFDPQPLFGLGIARQHHVRAHGVLQQRDILLILLCLRLHGQHPRHQHQHQHQHEPLESTRSRDPCPNGQESLGTICGNGDHGPVAVGERNVGPQNRHSR